MPTAEYSTLPPKKKLTKAITNSTIRESAYWGAFVYYLDYCQFRDNENVQLFCITLIDEFDNFSFRFQQRVKQKFVYAWIEEARLNFPKNRVVSPFGNNQKAWHQVGKKVLQDMDLLDEDARNNLKRKFKFWHSY